MSNDSSDGGKHSQPHRLVEKRYEAICDAIRFTDDISFKLLGLVPLLSGAVIVVVLKGEVADTRLVWLLSAFGAAVSFGLLRWELRNIQTCKWLITRAAQIETEELGLTTGQFAGRESAPRFLDVRVGKTEAEKLIYMTTILAWLALPWVALYL